MFFFEIILFAVILVAYPAQKFGVDIDGNYVNNYDLVLKKLDILTEQITTLSKQQTTLSEQQATANTETNLHFSSLSATIEQQATANTETNLHFSSLSATIEQLSIKVEQLSIKVDEVSIKVDEVSIKVDEGFKQNHEIEASKASFLNETTADFMCAHSTLHSAAYNDKIFTVGVKHSNCSQTYPPEDVHMCPGIDVVIYGGCPKTSKAINITLSAELRAGDRASTFGRIDDHKVIKGFYWTGILSGRIGKTGDSNSHEDSYLFQAYNFLGMSGGASLNGCGYTGIVHANYHISSFSNALVIPASLIKECVDAHLNMLENFSDCPKTTIHNAPRSIYECA